MTDLPRRLPAGYGTGRCECAETPDDRCCKLGHPGVVPIETLLPRATVRATRYTVTCLPESDINYRHAAIHIEYEGPCGRRGELWSVRNVGAYLWPDGSWRDHEFHAWPSYQRARTAAVAALDTTPSAQASAALARHQEPTT